MNEFLTKVVTQITSFFTALPFQKKIAVVGTGLGIATVMGLLFIWASQKTYEPLMVGLNPEDSSSIIKILREKRIPFRVDAAGKTIEVPPEYVLDLRMELATNGFPQNSISGYELFDKQSLGTTSSIQKLNEKRALEGELMRTIATVRGVKRARVHIATPPKSPFVEDQKPPSASVVLDLEPGLVLNEKQIFGIGNLVARAVPSLDIENVVIVDSSGKTLSKNSQDPLVALSASQGEFQRKLEMDLEKRIEGILSRVVGDGHVVARVSTELDFAEVQETQTMYDADGAATLSVAKDNASAQSNRPAPGGAAGAKSNTPGELQQQQNLVNNDTKKNYEVTNFKIPETVRRTKKPSGNIKKMSVAVLVDGKATQEKKEDGTVLAKMEPWPPETLKKFEQLVASTVGIDAKRGDVIEIKNMDFKSEDLTDTEKLMEADSRRAYFQRLVVYLIFGVIIAAFFFVVVRPFIKWITENTIDSVDTFLPQTLEELERLQKNAAVASLEEAVPLMPDRVDPEKVEGEMIKEKVVTLIDAHPQKAALVLREWVRNKKDPAALKAESGDKGKTA